MTNIITTCMEYNHDNSETIAIHPREEDPTSVLLVHTGYIYLSEFDAPTQAGSTLTTLHHLVGSLICSQICTPIHERLFQYNACFATDTTRRQKNVRLSTSICA